MSVLLKPTQGGRPIVLDKPILLIGRHPDCDVILKNSGKISRKHCCVALVDNRFVVRDLDSMNGVWVNGKRVDHSATLGNGDELIVGDLHFQVQRSSGKQQPEHTVELEEDSESGHEPSRLPRNQKQNAAERVAEASLKEPRRPDEAGPEDAVRFSSAFPVPPSDSGDELDIPMADSDD